MKDFDQFYTRPDLAQGYVDQVLSRWENPDVLFVEPSAGKGAFLEPLLKAGRRVRAIDIDPKLKKIGKRDFLSGFDVFKGDHPAIVVIGNPPFGRGANQAVRFFNHAAAYADEIAFIVPRTFRKLSVQNRLHGHFHLSNDDEVERDAFLWRGNFHNVPCAWQIWTWKEHKRFVPEPPSIDHLITYTPTPRRGCFAMRRVGFYAGHILTRNIRSLSQTSHYFIREMKGGVRDVMRDIDWTELARQTVGVRSLSKSEIAFKLDEVFSA